MSLKAIAEQELSRLKAGGDGDETERETRLKQMKQAPSCFIEVGDRFRAMKHVECQKTNKNGACFTVSSSRTETDETSLPEDVASGLARLKITRAPRLLRPDAWSVTIADAAGLARDGWAAQALALGWSPLNLFGAVTDARGDPHSDGLAAWLFGRKLVAICDDFAVAECGAGRAYFNRREQTGARFLWEIE